jgi:hypothetical protein
LLAQPSAPRLRALTLVSELPPDGAGPSHKLFAPLWEAPWFSQLQELSLTAKRDFGRPRLGLLLGPLRAAPLLRKLVVDKSGRAPALSAGDGRALAAAALPELRELEIYNIIPGLVAALAAAPWLGQLGSLMLSSGGPAGFIGGLDAEAGRALASAPLPSLKQLHICNAEPAFVAACAAAPWLERLERLNLRSEGDPLDGGDGPPGSPYLDLVPFTALVELSLCDNGLAPSSETSRITALVAAPWFSRLQVLSLHRCRLGTDRGSDGAGLRALAAAPLPNLTSLDLRFVYPSAADVSGVLSSAPWLATLTCLELAANHLGAPGHRALSLLHLPRLRRIHLLNTGFDGESLAALVSAPWLTQLAELTLVEDSFAPYHSCTNIPDAIEDDAWVFGRLRRLGCTVVARMTSHVNAFMSDADELGGEGELESDDETESDDAPGSEPGTDPATG